MAWQPITCLQVSGPVTSAKAHHRAIRNRHVATRTRLLGLARQRFPAHQAPDCKAPRERTVPAAPREPHAGTARWLSRRTAIVLFANPRETSTRAQRLWGSGHFLLAGGAVTCEPLTVANTCPLTKGRGQSGAQSVGTVLLSLVGAPEGCPFQVSKLRSEFGVSLLLLTMSSRSRDPTRHSPFLFVDLIRFLERRTRFENTQTSSGGVRTRRGFRSVGRGS